MARRTRSNKLEDRTQRLKLAARTKPYTVLIAPTVHLGYALRSTAPSSYLTRSRVIARPS